MGLISKIMGEDEVVVDAPVDVVITPPEEVAPAPVEVSVPPAVVPGEIDKGLVIS